MLTIAELKARCDVGSFDLLTCLAPVNNGKRPCPSPANDAARAKYLLAALSDKSSRDDVREFVSCATCEAHCNVHKTPRSFVEAKLYRELVSGSRRRASASYDLITPKRPRRPSLSHTRNSAPAAIRTQVSSADSSPCASRPRVGSTSLAAFTLADPFGSTLTASTVAQPPEDCSEADQDAELGDPNGERGADGGNGVDAASTTNPAACPGNDVGPMFRRWPPLAPYCHRNNVKRLLLENRRPTHVIYVFKVSYTHPAVVKIGRTQADPKERLKQIQKDHDIRLDEHTQWYSDYLTDELADLLERLVHADLGPFRCSRLIPGKSKQPREYFECSSHWAQTTVKMWEQIVRRHWPVSYWEQPGEPLARMIARSDEEYSFRQEQESDHATMNECDDNIDIEEVERASWREINENHEQRLGLWQRHLLTDLTPFKTHSISPPRSTRALRPATKSWSISKRASKRIWFVCGLVIAMALWVLFTTSPAMTYLAIIATIVALGAHVLEP